ncbi:hypothetical protein C273_05962 [Staphylococcus massiliensis S46]|uniref:Uncharacterized protein n=1 Tax=Staphylococcus massiliensis S46 TaxID=1229783 RepID=K9ALH9_9STAP|nr:hypothetical protein C273_05962 [Staphylococcus massiliensis S46]
MMAVFIAYSYFRLSPMFISAASLKRRVRKSTNTSGRCWWIHDFFELYNSTSVKDRDEKVQIAFI